MSGSAESPAVSRRSLITAAGAIGAVGAAAFGLAGCAQGKPKFVASDKIPAGVEPVIVRVVDNAYQPARIEISAGQAVQWQFAGPGEHDVVAEDGSFVSELTRDGEYAHVFETPGEFAYDCSVHPEMVGTVTVRSS